MGRHVAVVRVEFTDEDIDNYMIRFELDPPSRPRVSDMKRLLHMHIMADMEEWELVAQERKRWLRILKDEGIKEGE